MDLEKIERLQWKNGNLVNSDKKGKMNGLCKAFKKLKNAEKLEKEDTDCLANFVDSFITVSTCNKKVGDDIAKTVKEVNQHRHSKTCRKYGGHCRFNYPRPPSPHTIIVQPATGDSAAKKKKLLESQRIIEKVIEVLEDKENVTKVFEKYPKEEKTGQIGKEMRISRICGMAKVSYNDYKEALGVSRTGFTVVYERDIDELTLHEPIQHRVDASLEWQS